MYFSLFNYCCRNQLGISILLTFSMCCHASLIQHFLQTGWSSTSCFGMFFHQLLGRNTAKRHFEFFFATKLSVGGLVAMSCSHSRTRTLVPHPSSTAHIRLLSCQYTDNVLEAAVRLSHAQIITILLNYRTTLNQVGYIRKLVDSLQCRCTT